uniref:Uncharacterized protein n=1 Tax=Solanum tuberosum TaxID=4113 RepID=M1A5B9_SOLTU
MYLKQSEYYLLGCNETGIGRAWRNDDFTTQTPTQPATKRPHAKSVSNPDSD